MYKNILITTDGSELGRKGVVEGLALANTLGAQATILTVSEPIKPAAYEAARHGGVSDPTANYDRMLREDMESRLKKFEEEQAKYDIEIKLAQDIDDHPAEAIVRWAENHDHDLIIMASHGRRGIRRMMLGSQTAEVVQTTKIPVLVVR